MNWKQPSCCGRKALDIHPKQEQTPGPNANIPRRGNNQSCPTGGERETGIMARKKPRIDDSVILFDVIYEDGTRSSRRKVAAADLADFDGDDHAKTLIMTQDREIAKMSGNPRGTIKTITRSPT
jgi:hypothetical protein